MEHGAEARSGTKPTLKLAAAGFIATAVAFGPARMGFGLFLPAFREDFSLSSSLAGLIAGGAFLAFLLALPLTAWLDARKGERVPVVAGALMAAAGFALVAVASGPVLLAAGVALAGASAGFCWAPFNDAAARMVPPPKRPGALSAVSTGTTIGVAAAGILALAVVFGTLDWRASWFVFAAASLVAALAGFVFIPRGRPRRAGARGPGFAPSRFLAPTAWPLYGTAAVFGVTNAVYLSFAADRTVGAGGLAGLPRGGAAAVIFIAYGGCGILGLLTGRLEGRCGTSGLLALIFAAFALSLALIGLTPGSWPGVVVSAGLHGAAVMTVSAVLSFWSLRIFPDQGAAGLVAALVAVAAGSVLGSVAGGLALERAGPQAGFLMFAVPPALVAAAAAKARRS